MRACDYNIYRIDYNVSSHERVSTCGGMDSEPTGRMITDKRTYFCMALNKEFAMVAFRLYHSRDEFISLTHVGQLDDIVWIQ